MTNGSEIEVDPDGRAVVINTTDFPISAAEVASALDPLQPMVAAMVRWTSEVHNTRPRRSGGMLDRDRYVTPGGFYDQVRLARAALADDVVGNVAETTESLAFKRVGFSTAEREEEDAWNQWAAEIDLDARLREAWRILFTDSQFVMGLWWGTKEFKVRGKTDRGNARRKTFTLRVPTAVTFIDSLKVVPVGSLMFGQERLAYVASRAEADSFDQALAAAGRGLPPAMSRPLMRPTRPAPTDQPSAPDPIVERLIESIYVPTLSERTALADEGIDGSRLYLLREDSVFRHTQTRPTYEPFAKVRMESVFTLLDMKEQLRQMDRAHLVAGPLRVDQRIATPDGWKPIGQAEVGDKVFGPDGKPTEIVGVFPKGTLPMFKVTFTDGAVVFCDERHPWTVRAPKGEWRTITLGEIIAEGITQPNGLGRTGAGQNRFRHQIPLAAPVELPDADLPLDPYLLGVMLGDGHFGAGHTPEIACGEAVDDQPWRDRSNPVVVGLQAAGIHGLLCRDRYIPEAYLWGSVDQRWALLQGLMDSDGSGRVGGGVIGTASAKLADGIVELAQSLGGVAYKREYVQTDLPFWHVDCQFSGSRGAPFRVRRKAAMWQPRKQAVRRSIAAVDRSEDAEAVCIKTAREDGLFCTEGYVLTHNTNFILIIKQGTDKEPAEPEEIAHLRANVRTIANVPVIVSDHRLSVEIVTPKLDTTLNRERYDTIDARLLARLYRMLVPTGGGAGGQDVEKLGKVIGANLQSERHMLLRTLEAKLFRPIFERNDNLGEQAKMQFYPARIALEFDAAFAQFLGDLRASREISRDTMLSSVELSQSHEARMLEREAEDYDDIFQTHVPFDSRRPGGGGADPADPAAPMSPAEQRRAGRQGGGNRDGGGAAPGTGQGRPPRRPRMGPSRAALLAVAKELDIKGRTRMTDELLLEAIETAGGDIPGQED